MFWLSFWTVAVNCWVWDVCNGTELGETKTDIGGGCELIVIWEEADFVPSASETAVSVTVAGFGMFPGAEYLTGFVSDTVPHAGVQGFPD